MRLSTSGGEPGPLEVTQLPWGRRGREGREAIAEMPNGLASETLQNLIKLRRDQGGKMIFFSRYVLIFSLIFKKKVFKKSLIANKSDCKSTPSVTVTL